MPSTDLAELGVWPLIPPLASVPPLASAARPPALSFQLYLAACVPALRSTFPSPGQPTEDSVISYEPAFLARSSA